MSLAAPQPTPAGGRPHRSWARRLGLALIVVGIVGASGGWYAHRQLVASLPALDGRRTLTGLAGAVSVERDAHGVPTITGQSRLDVARATGFVHAQERFFQMDLTRRKAAGELAALVGPAALPIDRPIRVHRFRDVARRAVAGAPAEDVAIAQAYADGVNAGLKSLGAPPFEYLMLRADPVPWAPEDSVLVALAMFIELQDETGARDSDNGVMHDVLPEPLFAFLAPHGTQWDAPIAGPGLAQPAVPGPEVFDLRQRKTAAALPLEPLREPVEIGSNNWAVAGRLTRHGGALLADDMHLGISVPNTWYRASLVFPDRSGHPRRVTGVTLPGAPSVIVGSNGHVAWGFTNSYGDWVDLVVLEPVPGDASAYLTPEGPRRFEHVKEVLHVKGGSDETLDVVETIWGPVIDKDHNGRARALRWTAHEPAAVNFNIDRLALVDSVEESQQVANTVGAPAQNFVSADDAGHIGWTIMGVMPRRVGLDGRLPASWADGKGRWDGWLAPAENPRIVDPPAGRIWTANARVVGGDAAAKIGEHGAGYDLGARAGQIRDDLLALDKAGEQDMLKVQLDDRALFLAPWRDLLLATLTPEAVAAAPRRAELRRLVDAWGGRAAVESAGYRLVRAFRGAVRDEAIGALTAECRRADPRFDFHQMFQIEGPLWALVTERPIHLLDPRFASWDALLLAAADATIEALARDGSSLASHTWGEWNTTRIQHPLSRVVPQLGAWLDMPPDQLPGDSHMPRFQSPSEGASERLVVSPGRESYGFFHMPCGQSGHPLSPNYGDGHAAWVKGEPTPFLPGPTVHTLTLTP